MNIEKVSVERLNPAVYNPRKELKAGDAEYEKLKRSIETFGYVEPVIWNKQTGNVVGGHQRLTVMKDLGYKDVDCVVVDLDETHEKALNIALNKIQGEWDNDKLSTLLTDLDSAAFDVSLTGFDAAEIDELMDSFYSHEAVQDEFDVDKEHEEVVAKGAETRIGDIWKLGEHRLMCGDSTSDKDFEKLMRGRRAQMAVTSPPYGVGKDYEEKGIEPWRNTMKPVIKNLTKYAGIVCWNIIDLYSTGTQFIEPTNAYSTEMFAERGYRPIWIRIWKKQGMNFGVGPYHLVTNKPVQQYEYITAFGNNAEPEYNDQEYVWLTQAYYTEYFARHKKLPRLNKVLKEIDKPSKKMTKGDMVLLAMAREKGVFL